MNKNKMEFEILNDNKEIFIEKFYEDTKKVSRIKRLLISIDQFFNVLIWNGSQDETISSHIGRRIKENKAYKIEKIICKFLRLLQSRHCIKSFGE